MGRIDMNKIVKDNQAEIKILSGSEFELTAQDFLNSWSFSKAVLAERLRKVGYHVDLTYIRLLLIRKDENLSDTDRAILSAAVKIIRDDAFKVIP